jgi:nitroreductase
MAWASKRMVQSTSLAAKWDTGNLHNTSSTKAVPLPCNLIIQYRKYGNKSQQQVSDDSVPSLLRNEHCITFVVQSPCMLLNAFETIVNHRRSTRKFADDIPVPEEVITKALELARLSPNSSNMQLWEFHWIKDPELKQQFTAICLNQSAAKTSKHLIAFVARRDHWKEHAQWNYNNVKEEIGDKVPTKKEKRGLEYYGILMPLVYRRDALGITALIRRIVCFVQGFKNPFMRINGNRDQNVIVHKSCALAAQTFMLAIGAQGFDTCPMEGFDPLRAKKALKLPRAAQITMIVAVGKGVPEGIHGERKRIPYEKTVIVH